MEMQLQILQVFIISPNCIFIFSSSSSKIITFDESTKNFVNSIKREVTINNPKLRNLKVEVDKKLYFND